MAENFWFKFYFKDWQHDTKFLSTEEKGLLIELIIYMRDRDGECPVDFRLANRLTEITTNSFQIAIASFRQNSIFDFEMRGETEFMISRKFKKEMQRSLIYTENGKKGGNPKLKKNRLTKLDKQKPNLLPNSNSISNSNFKGKEGMEGKPTFEDFWNLYEKKIDLPKAKAKWDRINQEDREKIMKHIPLYKKSEPDKSFRKNPATYLNSESWNNEIIIPSTIAEKSSLTQTLKKPQLA